MRAVAAATQLEQILRTIYTRSGCEREAAAHALSEEELSRMASSSCLPRGLTRAKHWAKSLDHDSFTTFLVTFAQGIGLYACVMARGRPLARAAAVGTARCADAAAIRVIAGDAAVGLCAAVLPGAHAARVHPAGQLCAPARAGRATRCARGADPPFRSRARCAAVTDLMPFNTAVVTLNFVTLFSYVCIQCFFGCAMRQRITHAHRARTTAYALPRHSYREYWCIEAFDEEPTLSGDNLKTELELYPKFKATLIRLNSIAFVLALGLDVLVIACVGRHARVCARAWMRAC
jgi:hypothetical protein